MKTKEEKKEYARKYYQANKEKRKAYNEANKEKQREYFSKYGKKYYKANKIKRSILMKAVQEAQKDGYYTVYYLKEEHYVGMTTSLSYRLRTHKCHHNRHIEDVEIIGKYETKKGATRVEAALHSMGYLGRHQNYKQQTLKQLL